MLLLPVNHCSILRFTLSLHRICILLSKLAQKWRINVCCCVQPRLDSLQYNVLILCHTYWILYMYIEITISIGSSDISQKHNFGKLEPYHVIMCTSGPATLSLSTVKSSSTGNMPNGSRLDGYLGADRRL